MGKLGLDVDRGLFLGIDFGTTNSVISIFNYDEEGSIQTIEIEGSHICPTAIAFEESYAEDGKLEKIFGIQAKEGAVIYPDSTILGIKRLLSYDQSIEIHVEEKTYEFEPVQIAGEIIAFLKEQADQYIREQYGVIGEFSGCVITVPANSIDKQKQRTKEAAILAGFSEEQVHIRLEPAAAAISYATTLKEDKTVLVYDFGGGTFDACILSIEASDKEPLIQIISTYGDNVLGGNDIDKIMMDMIYHEFCRLTNHNIDLFDFTKEDGISHKHKKMAIVRLNQVANMAKEKLSSTASTKIVMTPFLQEPELININMEVTVEAFISHQRIYQMNDTDTVYGKMKGKSVIDLVNETIHCCRVCLESGKLSHRSIDEIFLVGGSSAIPLVKQSIAGYFKKEPFQSRLSPALSISKGAAKYGQLIAMPKASGLRISETTIHSLGLEMAGRRYLEVIPKGIEIPDEGLRIELSVPLETNFDQVSSMVIVVYENMIDQEPGVISYVYDEGMRRLAGTTLKGIPKALKGQEKVQLVFGLSKDHLLNVEAKSLSDVGVQTSLTVEALYN